MAKKLKLVYASETSDEAVKSVTLTKKPGYVPQVWASPFSASKKRNYEKLPLGPSVVLDNFMWLGSGRDADDLATLQSLVSVLCRSRDAPNWRLRIRGSIMCSM